MSYKKDSISKNWRKESNFIIAKISRALNDYRTPRNNIYKELERRCKCNLSEKLDKYKNELLEAGMALSKVSKKNYLDLISRDERLKAAYIAIVNEMAVKHGVGL